jgi:ATP-dependent DNA ligase
MVLPTDYNYSGLFCDMAASTQEEADSYITDPLKIYEKKYDGTFGCCIAKQVDIVKDIDLIGRGVLKSGEQQCYNDAFTDLMPSFEELLSRIAANSFIITGEIVSLDENGNESFKAIESRCTRKKDRERYAKMYPAQFMIFDILELDGRDLRPFTFEVRRNELEKLKPFIEMTERLKLIEQCVTPEDKRDLLDRVLAKKDNIEGIVIKDRYSSYPNGIFKFKPVITEDVFWEGDFVPGNKKNTGKVGSLICYQYIIDPDTGVHTKVEVARVGGGITDELRNHLTEMAENGAVTPENPRVIEVQAHELFPSGKMRYPNFIRWRVDKGATQCTRTLKIIPTKAEARKAAGSRKKKAEITEKVEVKLSYTRSSIDDWI